MEKLKLHDNYSFETKQDAGLDHWKGDVTFEIEAHAANESDIGMQFLQTISEMGEEELIELYRNDLIKVNAERSE